MENLSVIKDQLKGKFLKDVNLLNHIGYFCHDPKKAKLITEPQSFQDNTRINGERIEIVYKVSPNVEFGYPSCTAFGICDFLDRILSHYGRPAQNPIPFDMVSIRQFLNLKKSGKNNKTIKNALRQLRATLITTSHFFLDRSKKFIESDYTIIEKLVFVGEKNADGKDIKAGLIYLNEDIIKSFNNKNQMPVNYERYADLPSATKVLYLKLFHSFSAARKAGKTSGGISVENDYNALCRVLGFTPQKFKSDITRQLAPHLVTLKDVKQLVKSWGIRKKRNQLGFKLKTSPGKGFDEDHEQFNKKPGQEQLELDFNKRDTKKVTEIETVWYFQEKMFGLKPNIIDSHVDPKEVAFSKKLLKIFPEKKIYKFIDYAVQETKNTGFPIKTFNGLSSFINAFNGLFEQKKQLKELETTQKTKLNKLEEARALYRQFIDETYNKFLQGLMPAEKEIQKQNILNKIENNSLCRGKDENSPLYIGFKENVIARFVETNLIKNKESEFKYFLKTHNKNHLLDVDFSYLSYLS